MYACFTAGQLIVLAWLACGTLENSQRNKEGGNEIFTNSVGMQFRSIPSGHAVIGAVPGDFDAGDSETPRKIADIPGDQWLQISEVTNGQFSAFVEATGYKTSIERIDKEWRPARAPTWRTRADELGADYPVAYVTFEDACAFSQWLSEKEGRVYRLPTEVEWEYCCRSGSNTRFATGDSADSLNEVGWVGKRDYVPERLAARLSKAEIGVRRSGPRESSSGSANSWGFLNMHGNVEELVDAWFAPYDDPVSPSDAINGNLKIVVRGGSWRRGPDASRCSARGWIDSSHASETIGFRLVLDGLHGSDGEVSEETDR